MGNWRRVHIVGGMLAEEVEALRAELDQAPKGGMFLAYRLDRFNEEQLKKFGPLSYTGGLCGIGNWPAPSINAVGNLAGCDYTAYHVADHLRHLASIAPSLGVVVHCGDEYENETCTYSVVLFERAVVVGPPQIERIGDLSTIQIENNLLKELLRHNNRLA